VTGLWAAKAAGCPVARTALIEGNAGLVSVTRRRVVPVVPVAIDVEDLLAEGYLALVCAVDRYEPARGVKFATFAIRLIRGGMLEWLRHEDWAPRSVREHQRAVEEAERVLAEGGRPVDPVTLAAHLDLTPEGYAVLEELAGREVVRWEDPVFTGQEGDWALTYADQVRDPAPGPAQELQDHGERERLWAAVRVLEPATARIFERYYRDGQTFKAISRPLGKSEASVHYHHGRGLAALRQALPAEFGG
jgi:RNA polymerase sigma factor FliA